MANYYNHFSESIENITPEEVAWIREQLDSDNWEDETPPLDSEDSERLLWANLPSLTHPDDEVDIQEYYERDAPLPQVYGQ